MTEDIEAVNGRQSGCEARFREHLDSLLGAISAKVNKTKPRSTQSLQIATEKAMTCYPFSYDPENYQLQGQADYTVWYDRERDIDTNLVIFESKGGLRHGDKREAEGRSKAGDDCEQVDTFSDPKV